jgi:hypothetical protein
MAKHDVQNVSYMRKDRNFLADGTWYITTPCPLCGLVDEEVSWDEAKTPHHAGLIADERHVECNRSASEADMQLAARAEITAAEQLLEQQKINLAQAQARAASALGDLHIAEAEANLKRHLDGLEHAKRRVEDVRRHNS